MENKSLILALPIALLLSAPLVPGGAQEASARHDDYADLFYDDLSPHGEWIVVREYGRCWRPRGVRRGWRPYSDGYWEYTDYGLTWIPEEPWGFYPYHYGRWFYEPAYGWLWVPGREWAPAWVIWRRGGGYTGWAPMPPWVSGPPRRTVVERIRIPHEHWCFVNERRLIDRDLRHHVVAPARNVRIVNVTQNVTNYVVVNQRVVNRSVEMKEIERVVGRQVKKRRIETFERRVPPPDWRPAKWRDAPTRERHLESEKEAHEARPGRVEKTRKPAGLVPSQVHRENEREIEERRRGEHERAIREREAIGSRRDEQAEREREKRERQSVEKELRSREQVERSRAREAEHERHQQEQVERSRAREVERIQRHQHERAERSRAREVGRIERQQATGKKETRRREAEEARTLQAPPAEKRHAPEKRERVEEHGQARKDTHDSQPHGPAGGQGSGSEHDHRRHSGHGPGRGGP